MNNDNICIEQEDFDEMLQREERNFKNKEFRNVKINNSILYKIDFSNSCFYNVSFKDVDFLRCIFDNCDLEETKFEGNINFVNSSLTKCIIKFEEIEKPVFQNCEISDLYEHISDDNFVMSRILAQKMELQ